MSSDADTDVDKSALVTSDAEIDAEKSAAISSDADTDADKSAPISSDADTDMDKKGTHAHPVMMEITSTILLTIACFLFLRGAIAEARVIPSGSMLPTLQINDRIVVEKLSTRILGRSIEHGDILVFYPPKIETGMTDSNTILNIIPFIPEKPPAFIKRVVGLPGDRIDVEKGVGIFVNGKLVSEASNIPKPDYNLHSLRDIGGVAMTGAYIRPFGNSNAPIIVPPDQLFMLGDNHNNSGDSHVWGFLDEKRVIGRECFTIWRDQWLSAK